MDIELMLRAKAGDLEAFQELVRRYRGPLQRFFAAVLRDPSQADDLVQETFLRLWLNRERYEPAGKFSTYLFQIGKRCWLNERRKFRPALDAAFDEAALHGSAVGGPSAEVLILQRHRSARIEQAVRDLPERYRAVFELSHVDGLKYAQIAKRLGVPVGTVKSRMAEAVRRLREALTAEEESDAGV